MFIIDKILSKKYSPERITNVEVVAVEAGMEKRKQQKELMEIIEHCGDVDSVLASQDMEKGKQ